MKKVISLLLVFGLALMPLEKGLAISLTAQKKCSNAVEKKNERLDRILKFGSAISLGIIAVLGITIIVLLKKLNSNPRPPVPDGGTNGNEGSEQPPSEEGTAEQGLQPPPESEGASHENHDPSSTPS
jgi:hypothetical protein